MKAIPPESLSSTVEKVNENRGHGKRRIMNMRIMNTSWQVVMLWQVPLAAVILLGDLYLLSPQLKSDFKMSEMRNLKKKKADELNRVLYLTIAQADEAGINQSTA